VTANSPSNDRGSRNVKRFAVVIPLMLLATVACGEVTPRGQIDADLVLRPHNAPLDSALAAQGESDFRSRGCIACHKVGGGKLVGPDLLGVTRRRTFEWYRLMVLRPDSMVVYDSAATALLREYATPMTDQRASESEVRSIWEFLRQADLPQPDP